MSAGERFSVLRGAMRDSNPGEPPRYRQGWFWVSRAGGLSYEPEGPFPSRGAAARHLWAARRSLRAGRGYPHPSGPPAQRLGRRTMGPLRLSGPLNAVAAPGEGRWGWES